MTRFDRRRRPAVRIALSVLATALLLGLAASVVSAKRASNGLAYSTASAGVVQRQPSPGTCHVRGAGLFSLPDSRCTPGALNPSVTQRTIGATICRRGWTATVRPSASVTRPEKLASLAAYGDGRSTAGYEYDHLVALELGGAANDARNLWPEPDYPARRGFYLNPKDRLEAVLHRLVCKGTLPLSQAQRLIAVDWVATYRRYG